VTDLSLLPLFASLALPGSAAPPPDTVQMLARIEILSRELEELKAQVAAQQAANTPPPPPPPPLPISAQAPPARPLNLWGYGEAYLTMPTRVDGLAQADLARAVFGIGYQFSDATRFNSEFEVEHAVSSSSDPGEFEVEQFYVDQNLGGAVSAQIGLFLIPTGLLNEHHEPTNFYGVQRNFVETLIIPSTWREGGVSVEGDHSGVSWAAGLTTGLDLSRWSFHAPPPRTALELEDQDNAPMQATHQELALAAVHGPSGFLSARFHGIPGLTVGASLFAGDAVPPSPSPAAHVTLWEGHCRYEPGRWDLSALYARGTFTGTAPANLAEPGAPNPLPAAFFGWYLQGAFRALQRGDFRLVPFVRYEVYDMGARYEGLSGSPPPSSYVPRDHVFTFGANVYVNPGVVLKWDVQAFQWNQDFTRVDLSLGLSF
jgi:hypothetical protein